MAPVGREVCEDVEATGVDVDDDVEDVGVDVGLGILDDTVSAGKFSPGLNSTVALVVYESCCANVNVSFWTIVRICMWRRSTWDTIQDL